MKDQPIASKKTSRIVFGSLVAGIVIVLNLFFNYSASLVFTAPTFEGFCPVDTTNRVYSSKEQCVSFGGAWTENTAPYVPEKTSSPVMHSEIPSGWCDATYTCQKGFADAQSIYNRNIFIVLVALGVLSIVIGFIT